MDEEKKLQDKAREFAIAQHKDQKYGDRPYVFHLDATQLVLATFGYDNELYQSAGILHDILEDTGVTVEELDNEFGPEVATFVWAVTGRGKNRRECNDSISKKLALVPAAIPIKLADRIANVEAAKNGIGTPSLFGMYRDEHDVFEHRLRHLRSERNMWDRLNKAFGLL